MLYYLFTYLREAFGLSGAGVWQFITFRTSMAIILSLVITLLFGKSLIRYLQKKQIGETIRDLGLQGENAKKGTPTMGGIIIIAGILVPTLLFARVMNIYILMMVLSTIWLGLIGFLDDYIKVFKKNKEGLAGRFKIIGQVGLGIIIGSIMYFNDNVVSTREVVKGRPVLHNAAEQLVGEPTQRQELDGRIRNYVKVRSAVTSVPFNKNHEISFAKIASFFWRAQRESGHAHFVYSLRHFHHYSGKQWRQYHRWFGWLGHRHFRHSGRVFGRICLRVGQLHFCRIFEHYAHSQSGRTVHFYGGFRGRLHRVSLVQYAPSAGLHG